MTRKRNKRYKPVDPTAGLRVIQRMSAAQSKEPLNKAQLTELAIAYHGALEAMRIGQGTEADFDTLGQAHNIAVILAEAGLGRDWIETIRDARKALEAVRERAKTVGRFVFDGPGLKAITDMVAIHDAQLEQITEGEVIAAVEMAKRTLKHQSNTVQCLN